VFERCYGDQGSSKSQRATRGDAGIGVCPASSFKPTSENLPSTAGFSEDDPSHMMHICGLDEGLD